MIGPSPRPSRCAHGRRGSMGLSQGQQLLRGPAQRLGALRDGFSAKVRKNEKLFPTLNSDNVNKMLQANKEIQTLLMGSDEEVSELINDGITLSDSVTGDAQVVEMDSKIQLEVKKEADGSYELIAMLVRDTIEESEEKLAGMKKKLLNMKKLSIKRIA